jgi:hypothetical protein
MRLNVNVRCFLFYAGRLRLQEPSIAPSPQPSTTPSGRFALFLFCCFLVALSFSCVNNAVLYFLLMYIYSEGIFKQFLLKYACDCACMCVFPTLTLFSTLRAQRCLQASPRSCPRKALRTRLRCSPAMSRRWRPVSYPPSCPPPPLPPSNSPVGQFWALPTRSRSALGFLQPCIFLLYLSTNYRVKFFNGSIFFLMLQERRKKCFTPNHLSNQSTIITLLTLLILNTMMTIAWP